MRKFKWVAFAMAFAPIALSTSAVAEVRLFGGGHFQGSGKPVAEAFTKKTGIPSSYTPGNTGAGGMAERLKAGEIMDVIVMNRDDINNQVKAGLVKADSVVIFSRDRISLAVKKGAPKPDISTPAKLRAVLLAAKTIGLQQPDAERPNRGANTTEVLTNLGILAEVRKRAVVVNDPATALKEGKAEISFWSHPEVITRTDIDLVGPTPLELGGFTEQAVGILTRNTEDADARAFIRFITSADGEAVWTKTGLDPMPKKP